jgi:calmodulin
MSKQKISPQVLSFFTTKQIQTFQNAFNAFDEDGDERNPVNVLGKLLRAVDYLPRPDEIEDMIEGIKEEARPLGISFEDFVNFVYYHARYANPVRELEKAFHLFDKDRTGWLSVDTIKNILRSFKPPLSDTEIGEVLMVADISKDNLIKYSGFVEKLLHL